MKPAIPIRDIAAALHALDLLLAAHEEVEQRLALPVLLHCCAARVPLKHAHPVLGVETPQHKERVRVGLGRFDLFGDRAEFREHGGALAGGAGQARVVEAGAVISTFL
jgi:hypothetical protein